MKIEKGKPVKPARSKRWAFEKMKEGDSFVFEDAAPSTVLIAFGCYLAKGKYTIRREGKGYRFHLLKKT